MICAEFFRKNGRISGFEIKGHAGYAESGNDIVCASVSSAVQTICNAVTDIFLIEAEVSVENNLISLRSALCDENLHKLCSSLAMQLELLSQDFNGTINMKFTEV